MNGLSLIRTLNDIGIRSVAWRAYYEVVRKSGWLKHRYPQGSVDAWNTFDVAPILDRVKKGEGFFVAPNTPSFRSTYRKSFPELASILAGAADRIQDGEIKYFSKLPHKFDDLPDWLRNPFTGSIVTDERHWSDLGFYSPSYGDLKFVLELSRFSSAYALVRAYRYTGDERYPATFWRFFEDWAANNPPQSGPLWICGQESALRTIAWCFAIYGFGASKQLTAERAAKLVAVIAAHVDRIEGTIAYARSQKNNHALSEAIALWTVGLLFPEIEQADRWRVQGRRLLEEEAQRQIYDDGSYVQHSVNYHRLMLHLLLWAVRLGEANHQSLSDELYRRFDLATQFLHEITDGETGLAPNYGANDGALLLPLNSCDYTDYRPVIQASNYLTHEKSLFAPGPWDEDLLWFFGRSAVEGRLAQTNSDGSDPARREETDIRASVSFSKGGYYTMRGRRSWAFIRCAHYTDRPGQADQLHFDLWWHGQNIVCDAGSYSYNGEPPWDNGLAVSSVHNTVTADDQDQMKRGGRFLWLDWAQGGVRYREHSISSEIAYWEGEHNGYQRLKPPVQHRRAIVRIGRDEDHWLICDKLTSIGEHSYRLHWLFPDSPNSWTQDTGQMILQTGEGPYWVQVKAQSGLSSYSLVRGDEHSNRGWRSLYYGYKEAALSMDAVARASSQLFHTVFGPTPCVIAQDKNLLGLTTKNWQATLLINNDSERPLISSISVLGNIETGLEIS